MSSPKIRSLVATAVILSVVGLGGCSASDTDTGPTPTDSAVPAKDSAALTVQDAWVKAADAGTMSAAFGVLANSSKHAIRVTAATSAASASLELHETVPSPDGGMVMRPKRDGFVVPADGELVLQPGSNHLMLMGVKERIRPGDEVEITLTLSDGSTYKFTARAKAFVGADEKYAQGQG